MPRRSGQQMIGGSGGLGPASFSQPGVVVLPALNPRSPVFAGGAKGDGITDDTLAMQAFLNAVDTGLVGYIPPGNYLVTDLLGLPTNSCLFGAGPNRSIITQATAGLPVMVSKNWASSAGTRGWSTAVNGRTFVSGLTFNGATGTGAHGLVLRDFYTRVWDCEFTNCGGNGLYITPKNQSGTNLGSTMVETRVWNCAARSCGTASSSGWGFQLGEIQDGKTTDGWFLDCIVDAGSGAQPNGHALLGAAGGWRIAGFHGYGNVGTYSLRVANAYRTRISDLYIESYWTAGLYLQAVQQAAFVRSSFIGRHQSNGSGAAILIDAQGGFTPVVHINELTADNSQATNPTNLIVISNTSGGATATVKVGGLEAIAGTNTGTITNFGGTGAASVATVY